MVFEGIKEHIVANSLVTFLNITYQCLNKTREQRPTAHEVVLQLKEALDFQMDCEIWEPKLPKDYKEIIEISNSPDIYSDEKKEHLYNIFSNGILLQQGDVVLSFDGHGERNELISATKFTYENHSPHKWRSLTASRFHKVAEMLDISNMMIKIETKPQLLSPDVVYGVHLVFKFCKSRDCSSEPVYVNLKYKMGDETYHSHFATQRDQEWMMIELYRFLNQKDNVELAFLIESLSPFNRGDDDVIYVEGIEFRAHNNASFDLFFSSLSHFFYLNLLIGVDAW
ncbi:F-box protein At2g02240-like [Rutidosis leptorrhynchoides]|uniref:F-box protein At2g02240-like n=1 Tax=Rutidosis leptorrhynchoides TaxID=125765 RepID=UPI003A9999D8